MHGSADHHRTDPIRLLAAVLAVDPSLMSLREAKDGPCSANQVKAALKSRTAGLFLQAIQELSLNIDADHARMWRLLRIGCVKVQGVTRPPGKFGAVPVWINRPLSKFTEAST